MNSPAKQPCILFVFNHYLGGDGGEGVVVKNEMQALKDHGYSVYYHEYNNRSFRKFSFSSLFTPANLFFNAAAFIRTWLFVRKHKIDVVHAHNFHYTASPSVFWAAKIAGAKTVMTVHNYRLFCLNSLFLREDRYCFDCHTARSFATGISAKCFRSSALYSSALASSTMLHRKIGTWKRKLDLIIVLNPLMRQLFMDIGVAADRILLKPNFLVPSLHEGIEERKDFFLFAGRLAEEKGILHLIETFRRTGKNLIIAGDGDLRTWVEQHAGGEYPFRGTTIKRITRAVAAHVQSPGFSFVMDRRHAIGAQRSQKRRCRYYRRTFSQYGNAHTGSTERLFV